LKLKKHTISISKNCVNDIDNFGEYDDELTQQLRLKTIKRTALATTYVKPKTDILLHKYIGYYLLHNQSIIYNCARGTAHKNLEMDIFKLIKIPIPSLERQKEIV